MPRRAVRRKNIDNNNKGENEAPKPKRQRLTYHLPLPQRPRVKGKVLVCGQGDMGQLGLGADPSKHERKRPTLVGTISNAVDVKAGGVHSLVLTDDGRVYSFGCNDEGALGRDSNNGCSEYEPGPVDLPGKVLKISAGDSHSACLLEDGRVFAWGSFRDIRGNMGLTSEGNQPLPIDILPGIICCDLASGTDHLVMLTCQGKVYTMGCGQQGQLGRVSERTASGEGRRGTTELLRPGLVNLSRGRRVDAVWASNFCTFLRQAQTGDIWAFGLNNRKQFGMRYRGYNDNIFCVMRPVNIKVQNIKQIAGGIHHTLMLNEDRSVYAIGSKDYGRLGLGSLPADVKEFRRVRALEGSKVVSVSCGETQSFAITDGGRLYAWGMGSNYQLGTGSEDDVLEPVLIISRQTEGKRIIRADSGAQHSIFIVENEDQPNEEEKGKPAK